MPSHALESTPSQTPEFPDYYSPPPTDLPYDDGEPLESQRHRVAMNVLIRSLIHHWRDRHDFYCGGNMFIYYSAIQAKRRDFRGPDFFVVLDSDDRPRKSWVVWEEDGRYPDVIVELMSPSTRAIDTTDKKRLYERVFKTSEYFVFDPFDPDSLQGWRLGEDSHYHQIHPNPEGWLWCERLAVWLGTWNGTIQRDPGSWLRFYTPDQALVLLPEEAAEQHAVVAEEHAAAAEQHAAAAEQQATAAEREVAQAKSEADSQRRRAERLAERLRELGIDPGAA